MTVAMRPSRLCAYFSANVGTLGAWMDVAEQPRGVDGGHRERGVGGARAAQELHAVPLGVTVRSERGARMAHAAHLGAQVVEVAVVWCGPERDDGADVGSGRPQAVHLCGVVGQQPHGADADLVEDGR